MRRFDGLSLASAIGQPSQRVHGTVRLGQPVREPAAVRQVLGQTQFTDKPVALDWLHTQHPTLQQILYEHGRITWRRSRPTKPPC